MLDVNDEIVVIIEKLLYEGKALARADGFPIFIEGGVPQDKLKIRITSAKRNFAIGEIIEIVEPSPYRIKPFCALHNACGSCMWQHIDYEEQLKQKQIIVSEIMDKFSGAKQKVLPVIRSPKTQEYRHKIQYPVGQTKVSKRILAGYYKKGSHELVNIKHCPIEPIVIDEILEKIKEYAQTLGLSAYDEKSYKGILRHFVFKHSLYNGKTLVILVVNSDEIPESVDKLASMIFKNIKNIQGVVVNFNTQKSNVIMGKVSKCLIGDDFYEEKLGGKIFHISATSFFQVNPEAADEIIKIIRKMVSENFDNAEISLLDAYSGVSSFGIALSDLFKEIVCVEEIESAIEDAKENVRLNDSKNIEIFSGEASKTFNEFVKEGKKFDVVLVDPPRKGLSQEALDSAAKLSKGTIIYVSCNPTTLARDIKYLSEHGYEAQYIQPVDMFPHTYHVENVALIKHKQN